MIHFKTSENEKFKTIEGWQDVTLKKFIDSLELPEPNEKTQQYLSGEKLTAKEFSNYVIPYFCTVVSFWCEGLTYERCFDMKLGDLKRLYWFIQHKLREPEQKEIKPTIDFKGVVYSLPVEQMQKSTVAEFVDAAQLEHYASELNENKFSVLPKLCAILLREGQGEKREKYTKEFQEKTFNKRVALFMNLPMTDVWSVAFFLLKQSEQLETLLHLYSQREAIQ